MMEEKEPQENKEKENKGKIENKDITPKQITKVDGHFFLTKHMETLYSKK